MEINPAAVFCLKKINLDSNQEIAEEHSQCFCITNGFRIYVINLVAMSNI